MDIPPYSSGNAPFGSQIGPKLFRIPSSCGDLSVTSVVEQGPYDKDRTPNREHSGPLINKWEGE